MGRYVAAFTDTYLPTMNGITYTAQLWRERWAAGYTPGPDEHPVASVPAPLYETYRLGVPAVPDGVADADVVHVHTPFTLGVAGRRFARRADAPVVASYHTLLDERVDRLAPSEPFASALHGACRRYERWFFDGVDIVVTPGRSRTPSSRAKPATTTRRATCRRFAPQSDGCSRTGIGYATAVCAVVRWSRSNTQSTGWRGSTTE